MTRVHRVAVLVLLAGTACSKGEKANVDSAAGTTVAANAAALVTQQRRAGPGDLAKPLASYTGDELLTLVNSLTYVDSTVTPRRCRDLPGCGGGNPAVRAQINLQAIVGEDSVSPTSVAQFGTIVSRARNRGGGQEAVYGMRPGNRFQYFLIVLPDTGGTSRWVVEQLEVVGNNRTHTTIAQGRFRGCAHTYSPTPRAAFRTCDQAALIRPASFVQPPIDPPWWVNCATGCCVAE